MNTQHQSETATGIRISAVEAEEQLRRVHAAIANHAYEIFERRGGMGWHELEDWRTAEVDIRCHSCFGLTSSDDALLIGCNVATFEPDSIEVWVDYRRITVSGTLSRKHQQHAGADCYQGPVFRILELPAAIEPDRTFATVTQNYFLEVHLPLVEQRSRLGHQPALGVSDERASTHALAPHK